MPAWGRAAVWLVAGAVIAAPAGGQESRKQPVAAVVRQRLAQDLRALVPQRQEAPKLLAGMAGVLVLTRVDREPSRNFANNAPEGLTAF